MPIAGTHWGMREAMRTYYEQRTIYGEKLVYFGPGELADDWQRRRRRAGRFETFIPDTLQVGQPMTITIQLNKADDERGHGAGARARRHGDARSAITRSTVTLAPGERAQARPARSRDGASRPARPPPPVRAVDADRLIAWQLYWRGENFWSGDEIWGFAARDEPHAFQSTDNVEFLKYLNDRTRAPLGRRYFVVTEGGRVPGLRSMCRRSAGATRSRSSTRRATSSRSPRSSCS